MTDVHLIQNQGFFKNLEIAAAFCASDSDSLREANSILEKVREHRIAALSEKAKAIEHRIAARSEKEKASKAACLKEVTSHLQKAEEHNENRVDFEIYAERLKKEEHDKERNAFKIMFYHPQYNSQPFENLLVFLQRLQPKKAAETLKQIIAIVTNAEIKIYVEDEEAEEIARGKKSLWAIAYFRVMESVVKNALFCESIKINHKLNFSTNFLGFRVASLQYQGKMSQMRSIAYERLEMFKKRRHNLLTISAFLCFFFRKVLALPKGHHYSLEMKKLLLK